MQIAGTKTDALVRDNRRWKRDNEELRAACRAALTELMYLAEQVKAREGGSVLRAIQTCRDAIDGPDPFAKAGKIRRGELDADLPDFDEITGWIQRVPITWLPALLSQCVTSCLAGNVFQDGKLATFVGQCEKKFNEPAHGILRGSDIPESPAIGAGAPAAAGESAPAVQEDALAWHRLKLHEEKQRRVYYQSIVYDVCNMIDQKRGDKRKIVCGTVNTPTTQVQDTLRAMLFNRE